MTWQREVLRPYVHQPGPQAHADREAPRFDTPATVEAALQQAGFERMQILVEEGEFVLANDEEVWARPNLAKIFGVFVIFGDSSSLKQNPHE